MAGTLLVHALMFQATAFGTVAAPKKRPPDETGPGASAIVSSAVPSMTLVLIPQPEISEAEPLADLASMGVADLSSAIQIISPNPELAIDESLADAEAEDPMTVGDVAARSRLFGQYTGQLAARIERAWIRPRSPVEPVLGSEEEARARNLERDRFRCVVRITQDSGGRITEIELTRCNGSSAWQQSLVDAIQSTSPLPSPPDPTLLSRVLVMSFEGQEYRSGVPERGYGS